MERYKEGFKLTQGKAQVNMLRAQECAGLFAQISSGDFSASGEQKRLIRIEELAARMLADIQEENYDPET